MAERARRTREIEQKSDGKEERGREDGREEGEGRVIVRVSGNAGSLAISPPK